MTQKFTKFYRILLKTLFLAIITIIPNILFSDPLKIHTWANTSIKKSFPSRIMQNNLNISTAGFQLKKSSKKITSKIAVSTNKDYGLYFDQSFIELKNKNTIFGIGKINRNWSFSPNTSLILSQNARPTSSIYFKYAKVRKSDNKLISWAGPWSLDTFVSAPSSQNKIQNSKLLGVRTVIEPLHNLKFELLKTSQWGGNGQLESFSTFLNAVAGNSNEDKYAKINQMAGFGTSFLKNIGDVSSRFYVQLIGEDEAGSLPSCFMSLVGAELQFPHDKLFSSIGFEFIDTRIGATTHGNCGPNTAYNNHSYTYTNYNRVMGTSIDTESKSIGIWASTNISKNSNINYTIRNISFNDDNWSDHRLSSSKETGWIADIETSIKFNSYIINSKLTYQDFYLDKVKYENGLNFTLGFEYFF